MTRRYARVAVGGTFDRFHRGHEAILRKAFDLGDRVLIGVTTDEMLGRKRAGHQLEGIEARRKAVERFLSSSGLDVRAEIIVLTDTAGPTATDPAIDALVVSPETEPVALGINEQRQSNGLSPMDIVTIEFVMADDSVRISSTRIREGVIDREGRLVPSMDDQE
ncbi:MAG: phosphopantetheine adenylyltransferase [Candidatus Undinarchaeales archaeon]|jgi:pantetheine-phosphate adenylyltransferase|nr:phosphopantetheine adenylyltransferase [Candidatus Undinarchaeales archaeon]MDP7493533.1 phosphopantetheine adenylyltransferase [Candidatus Undinarchaeales archaeon]